MNQEEERTESRLQNTVPEITNEDEFDETSVVPNGKMSQKAEILLASYLKQYEESNVPRCVPP